jgi:hypothetical protein
MTAMSNQSADHGTLVLSIENTARWLENGCDPMRAAEELRIIALKMRPSPTPLASNQWFEAVNLTREQAVAVAELLACGSVLWDRGRTYPAGSAVVRPMGGSDETPAGPTWEELQAQCQAIWRTDVTLVCTLPKGHEGEHRNGRFTFNGEVDVRPAVKTPAPSAGGVTISCVTCSAEVLLPYTDESKCFAAIAPLDGWTAPPPLCPKCSQGTRG